MCHLGGFKGQNEIRGSPVSTTTKSSATAGFGRPAHQRCGHDEQRVGDAMTRTWTTAHFLSTLD